MDVAPGFFINCPNGGNIQIRDVTGQLASMAYSHVTPEPLVREVGTGDPNENDLVCDLAVRGVWQPQTEVLFDFHVCNGDAQSYANHLVTTVLNSMTKSKRAKHREACWEHQADLTVFIMSTDVVNQRKGHHFLKRLASRLSEK